MHKLLMVICLLLVANATVASSPPSATVLKDDLKLVVSLSKSEFIEGEPIIVQFALMNDSDKPRRLYEPDYGIAGGIVVQVSGEKPLPTTQHGDTGLPPDWEFLPHEVHTYAEDIQCDFVESLPVGEYTIKASCLAFRDANDFWRGHLKAPKLTFCVVPATGAMTKASELFIKASRQVYSKDEALKVAEDMRTLSDPAKGSVFSPYAGYFEAVAYQEAGDTATFIAKMRQYVQDHRDVPVFGKRALYGLAWQLFHDKNYMEAREVYLLLPDGSSRQRRIKDCDDQLMLRENN